VKTLSVCLNLIELFEYWHNFNRIGT